MLCAGAVGDGVETEKGPDLGSAVEAAVRAHAGEVGSSVHMAQAGDSREVAGRSLRDERDETPTAFLDESFGGGVLEEKALDLLGKRGGDVRGKENGVIGPGAQRVEQSRPSAAHVFAVEVKELLVGHSDQVVRIGAVSEKHTQAVSLEGASLDDGSRLG